MIQKGWNTGTSLQNFLDTVSSLSFIFDPCDGSKALRGRLSIGRSSHLALLNS